MTTIVVSVERILKRIQILSRNQVKWIAMIAMFVRHLSYLFLVPSSPLYNLFSEFLFPFSRFAYPLFAVLSVEGTTRTHHLTRNLILLAVFGIITEPLFDLYFYGTFFYLGCQNIMWLYLAFGLFYLAVKKSRPFGNKSTFARVVRYISLILLAGIMLWVADFSNINYGFWGLLGMFLAYLLYSQTNSLFLATSVIVVLEILRASQWMRILSLVVILLYNPNKKCSHSAVQKYSGYAFYPGHMALFIGLKAILYSSAFIDLI